MSGPDTAGMREALADTLLAHQPVYRGRSGPIVACLCGEVRWGDSFSRHVADALLPVVQRLAVEKAAEVEEDARLAIDVLLGCLDEIANWDSARAAHHRNVGVREYAAGIARAYRIGRGDFRAAAAQPGDDR